MPSARWVKVNMNGSAWSGLGHRAGGGGIFGGSRGKYIGGFSTYSDILGFRRMFYDGHI